LNRGAGADIRIADSPGSPKPGEMDMTPREKVVELVKNATITAETTFRDDQFRAYQRAIERETSEGSKWAMQAMVDNARIASSKKYPLCDDTGIPHLYVELGSEVSISGDLLMAMREGVAAGQRELPTRPMGVLGNDIQRLAQSAGLSEDPAAVTPPAMVVVPVPGDELRVTVLMFGGGPEIRSKTHMVYHKRNAGNVIEEAARWAAEAASQLGCTPMIPCIGIGRTHYEAATMMLQAAKDGDLDHQSDLENMVTEMVNSTGTGSLGLRGSVTALGAFIAVGPARSSGVRIVCMRPCCSVDPRRGTGVLKAAELRAA
jgi:fumarate hydratase subunit alpha